MGLIVIDKFGRELTPELTRWKRKLLDGDRLFTTPIIHQAVFDRPTKPFFHGGDTKINDGNVETDFGKDGFVRRANAMGIHFGSVLPTPVLLIHQSSRLGDMASLKQLSEAGDLNYPDLEGRSALMNAVLHNQIKAVEFLCLQEIVRLDETDGDGKTAVHHACDHGFTSCLKILIRHGANIRIHDNEGRTALHLSIITDHLKCLKILLKYLNASEWNQVDHECMSALHWAVIYNRVEHFECLCQNTFSSWWNFKRDFRQLGGKSGNSRRLHSPKTKQRTLDFKMTDIEGKTILHWAASQSENGLFLSYKILTQDTSILNLADLDGRTPLHLACAGNNLELVDYLTSFSHCDINGSDNMGRTPLHWSCVSGYSLIATVLLHRGADDGQGDRVGATPLHYACSKNHAQCIVALLSRKNGRYLKDKEGRSPLVWAVMKGHVQSCRILLSMSAVVDVNARDFQGFTALHAAAYCGQSVCTSLLIEKGANVNVLDEAGFPPIFRAVEKGHTDCTSALIQCGVSIQTTNTDGQSLLHWASICGHLTVCSLLLANGAHANERDKQGRTPVMAAVIKSRDNVVKFLLENGSDLNLCDWECRLTSLHYAVRTRNLKLVELLLAHGAKVNHIYNTIPITANTTATGGTITFRQTLKTALDAAIEFEDEDMKVQLKKKGGKTYTSLLLYGIIQLQSHIRGYLCRKRYRELRERQRQKTRDEIIRVKRAAASLQSRSYRRANKAPKFVQDAAARVIQSWWTKVSKRRRRRTFTGGSSGRRFRRESRTIGMSLTSIEREYFQQMMVQNDPGMAKTKKSFKAAVCIGSGKSDTLTTIEREYFASIAQPK